MENGQNTHRTTIAWMVPWLNTSKAGYGTFLGLSLGHHLGGSHCDFVLIGGYDTAFFRVVSSYRSSLALLASRGFAPLLRSKLVAGVAEHLAIRNLSKVFRTLQVDVVITNRNYPGLLESVQSNKCQLLLWGMDDPMGMTDDWLRLARHADHVWTHSYGSVAHYEEGDISNVEWLPLAFDHERFSRPQVRRVKYPLVFVGNHLKDREKGYRSVIEPIARRFGTDLHVFGHGWSRSARFSRHGEIPREHLSRVYPQCGIALGAHRDAQRETDCSLNLRVFETLGLGACLLSDRVEGLERLFEPGHDLVVGTDQIEMAELASYYLTEKDEREKIAANGRAEVLRNHTMRERAKQIWDVIQSRQ